MFLLAVMGIYNVEQVNTSQGLPVNVRKVKTESSFGILIAQSGILVMDEHLGVRIHKHWDSFYRNRLSRGQRRRGKENVPKIKN